MKATMMSMLIIAIASSSVFATVSRAQIQKWLHACDLSQGDHANCKLNKCLLAMKHLVKPETRHAYEQLGMGSQSELNDYERLYDYCSRRSQHGLRQRVV